jgi:hypothetical protein
MRQSPPGPQRLPIGATLRFALGSRNGPRSNTWSVIGGRTSDEVYLAARDVMGTAKLSMHSSGRWRWAMTSKEATRRQLAPGEDRVMGRWEEPAPVAPGWLHAATVCIPSSSLRALPPEKSPKKGVISFWSPAPGSGEVWFDIFIRSLDAEQLIMKNIHELVGRIDLPSGGAVLVVGTELLAADDRAAEISKLRELARKWPIESGDSESFRQMQEPTGAIWSRADDGRPLIIDLGDLRSADDG